MSRVPRINGGDQISRMILPARRRPLDPAALKRKLEPVMAEWIAAAADWKDLGLGESRCLVVQTPLTADTTFCVRMWSEPHAALLCEVPSGRQDKKLRQRMLNDAARWAEDRGLTITGKQENYRGTMPTVGAIDIATAAVFVVDALIAIIGYEGLTPLFATLAHDSRFQWHDTLDSFSETEVERVFRSAGFTVDWTRTETGDLVDPPEFFCRKAGTDSVINLMDPVPGMRLYQRVRFAADLPLSDEEAALHRREDLPPDAVGMVTISAIHAFSGGVTKAWLVERVREWDEALREHRRDMRRQRKRKPAPPLTSETIH
jgi:hypothetical protein